MRTNEEAPTLVTTDDGSHSLRSDHFSQHYHSRYGAITESSHVFIEAGLRPWLSNPPDNGPVRILELGFGTGLNPYLASLAAAASEVSVDYCGIEQFPITLAAAAELNYPDRLQQASPEPFLALHRAEWGERSVLSPTFSFVKMRGDFLQLETEQAAFHTFFFDAFAPDSQPELWETDTLQKAYDALLPGGNLVTYCAKGVVKRALRAVGFTLEALPGPPGKREMTRATK